MRGSGRLVAVLWLAFASVAIVSGWVVVQMVGNAVTPASIPVLTAGEVTQRLATSQPTDEPTPPAKPHDKEPSAKATPTATQKPSGSSSTQPSSQPPGGATTSTPKPPAPTAVVRTLASKGGSVVAACLSGDVALRSWSPAVGYRVDEVAAGPDHDVEIRFVSSSAEVKMQVRCISGVPAAQTEYDADSGDDH